MRTRLAADGTTLASHHWDPPGRPRSTVVLVHGLGEHAGRYRHVGEMLAGRGHAVRATDLRGFGSSGGRRAHLRDWEHHLDDLAGDIAEARGGNSPVVLLGHSLGGLVALSYALSDRPAPDLLVLSAPALENDLPRSKQVAARILGTIAPKLHIRNGLRGDQLSRDPTVGERYFADPLVLHHTTTGYGRHALRAAARARADLAGLRIPTLVLHGAADPIIPPRASEALAGIPGVERREFPEFRHEIFNEEGGLAATTAVADWIEARLAG
ncbi:MAG: lysophospholipase [Acidimicrobiia bacterium]|nr:lysophospholipase [Acidimicrobiia bacterium]